MILFSGCFVNEPLIIRDGWPLSALYFIFFLVDIVQFLLFWFMKPGWEFSVRTISILWIITLFTQIPPIGVGLGLFTVLIIQFPILIWPRWYILVPEEEETAETEGLLRFNCVFCGATYAYTADSVVNGKVVCQNCGKSFDV